MRPVTTFKPELASLDMGSLNFGLYPMLNRFQDFKHEWEVKHPENTGIWYSKIPSEILRKSCVSVIRTQHGLSLNATIFLIYTISHILLIKVWLGHHSSFNSFWPSGWNCRSYWGFGVHETHCRSIIWRWLPVVALGGRKESDSLASVDAAQRSNVRVGLKDSL